MKKPRKFGKPYTPDVVSRSSLRPRSQSLEEKIAERARQTVDTSNAENHPHIAAWHRRVIRDYKRWREKNGKGSDS